MAEVGEPFAFCGRIVEAYYSNPELDTVAIMWSDGEKNREYYVVVDEEDDQFNALLKEWSYESLDECTRNKNEAGRQEFRDAFQRYAIEQGLYTYGNPDRPKKKEKEEKEEIKALQKKKKKLEEKLEEVTVLNILLNVEDLIFNFDPENNQQKEELFKLKLKIFERDVVRNSEAKTKKTALRKAKSPLEVISIYYSFVKK